MMIVRAMGLLTGAQASSLALLLQPGRLRSSRSVKQVMYRVDVPVGEIGSHDVCTSVAQCRGRNGGGNSDSAHPGRASCLNSGRRIFYNKTLIRQQRQLTFSPPFFIQEFDRVLITIGRRLVV